MKQMRKVKMLLLSILMSCTFIITPITATQVSNTNYVAVCEAASISGTLKGTIKSKTYMKKTRSTSAKSLRKLTGGKKVKVLSVTKKWAKVKYDNKTGYVLWSKIKMPKGTIYWNGGKSKSKIYHRTVTAHGMKDAVPMTKSQAKSHGFRACKTCW